MNKTRVFIDGSAGTTGLRIYDRLSAREDIELISVSEQNRKVLEYRRDAMESADVAFLCLPDTAAREIVEAVGESEVKIIDTSTAHRTNPEWAYGFPELSADLRRKTEQSKRIAVPGCHASGFCSIVAPLVMYGIVPPDYPVSCTSVTGYSGGGKKMIAEYESAERAAELDAPRQYGVTQQHKHLPEMKAVCNLDCEPCFLPIVADFYSGMTVTIPLHTRLLSKKVGPKDIFEILSSHYAGQKLISVTENSGEMLESNSLSGKDSMRLTVGGNSERIIVASHFDNLGKGASGAAVQCFNIVTGKEETEGLVL